MEQKWIDQFNKKCAEFLGITCNGRRLESPIQSVELMLIQTNTFLAFIEDFEIINPEEHYQFHSDWNWIMEVVDRIENTKTTDLTNAEPFVTIRLVGCDIKFYNKERLPIVTNAKTKKEAVVKAIDQFIDWFNIQQIS